MIWLLAWRKERQNRWSDFILCFLICFISLKVSIMPAHLHADIVRDSSIIDEMIVLPIKSLCHSGKMKRPHQYQTREDEPYLKSMQQSIASSVHEKNMCCLRAQRQNHFFFFLMIFLYLNIYQKIKNLKETPTHSQQYYNVCQQTKFPRTEMGKKLFFLLPFIKCYWNIQLTLINFVWQISFILIYSLNQ